MRSVRSSHDVIKSPLFAVTGPKGNHIFNLSTQNKKWSFKPNSDRVVRQGQRTFVLRLSHYGDGSESVEENSWFFVKLRSESLKERRDDFNSQLKIFNLNNKRHFQFEKGDGHCGFWVFIRQLLVQLGIVAESEVASKESLAKGHLYLSTALRKHAATLSQMMLHDFMASGAMMPDGTGPGFDVDEAIEVTVSTPPAERTQKRQELFLSRRKLELEERSVAQVSPQSALSFLPRALWFGGLEYTDVRALVIEYGKQWAWIDDENTEVILISPEMAISRVRLQELIVEDDAVVSIFYGDHFNSLAANTVDLSISAVAK